jgi:hypothetical protein
LDALFFARTGIPAKLATLRTLAATLRSVAGNS